MQILSITIDNVHN